MENIVQKVSELLSSLTFIPNTALRLAFVGIILLVVLFALALVFGLFSNIKGLIKKLLAVICNLAKIERVDEENVEELNLEFSRLPESVGDGWSHFMEQRIGYPSDYMKEKSVLDENTYSTKNNLGKLFFKIFGFLAVALIATLATLVLADDAQNIGLQDFIKDFKVVGGIVGAVALPILFYIIFDVILGVVFRKQRKRLQFVYKSFLDTLDDKVVIFACEEEEFSSENLEQIAQNIEDLIAKRIDNKENTEVISSPKLEEFEKLDNMPEIEIEEEIPKIVEEEAVADFAPISKEEQQNYLAVLISIVDSAINDASVKISDLEEIAEVIYTSMPSFENKEDQEILEECLRKLSDVFYAKK